MSKTGDWEQYFDSEILLAQEQHNEARNQAQLAHIAGDVDGEARWDRSANYWTGFIDALTAVHEEWSDQ